MTDLERFLELYKSVGIELNVYEDAIGLHLRFGDRSFSNSSDIDDENDKVLVVGYIGFYTEITFDKEGNFISQGFWE